MSNQPTASDVMGAYALDAVDHAKSNFAVELDFSPGSVEKVEEILTKLCASRPTGFLAKLFRKGPSDDDVDQMAKMYGGYIGEVLLRRAGAGSWYFDDQIMPGLIVYGLECNGGKFWPQIKVHKRMANGPEDNVWFYYRFLESKYVAESTFTLKTVTEVIPGRPDPDGPL